MYAGRLLAIGLLAGHVARVEPALPPAAAPSGALNPHARIVAGETPKPAAHVARWGEQHTGAFTIQVGLTHGRHQTGDAPPLPDSDIRRWGVLEPPPAAPPVPGSLALSRAVLAQPRYPVIGLTGPPITARHQLGGYQSAAPTDERHATRRTRSAVGDSAAPPFAGIDRWGEWHTGQFTSQIELVRGHHQLGESPPWPEARVSRWAQTHTGAFTAHQAHLGPQLTAGDGPPVPAAAVQRWGEQHTGQETARHATRRLRQTVADVPVPGAWAARSPATWHTGASPVVSEFHGARRLRRTEAATPTPLEQVYRWGEQSTGQTTSQQAHLAARRAMGDQPPMPAAAALRWSEWHTAEATARHATRRVRQPIAGDPAPWPAAAVARWGEWYTGAFTVQVGLGRGRHQRGDAPPVPEASARRWAQQHTGEGAPPSFPGSLALPRTVWAQPLYPIEGFTDAPITAHHQFGGFETAAPLERHANKLARRVIGDAPPLPMGWASHVPPSWHTGQETARHASRRVRQTVATTTYPDARAARWSEQHTGAFTVQVGLGRGRHQAGEPPAHPTPRANRWAEWSTGAVPAQPARLPRRNLPGDGPSASTARAQRWGEWHTAAAPVVTEFYDARRLRIVAGDPPAAPTAATQRWAEWHGGVVARRPLARLLASTTPLPLPQVGRWGETHTGQTTTHQAITFRRLAVGVGPLPLSRLERWGESHPPAFVDRVVVLVDVASTAGGLTAVVLTVSGLAEVGMTVPGMDVVALMVSGLADVALTVIDLTDIGSTPSGDSGSI